MKNLITFGLLALAAVSCGGDDAAKEGTVEAQKFFCDGTSLKKTDTKFAANKAKLACHGEFFKEVADKDACYAAVLAHKDTKDLADKAAWTEFQKKTTALYTADAVVEFDDNDKTVAACKVVGIEKDA